MQISDTKLKARSTMVWRCYSTPLQRNYALEWNGKLIARVIFDTNIRTWLWYLPGSLPDQSGESSTRQEAQAAARRALS